MSENAYQPYCKICDDHGFTGCPEATLEDGRDLIVPAFKTGAACICAEGSWFAQKQMQWWSMEGHHLCPECQPAEPIAEDADFHAPGLEESTLP